MSAIPDMLDKGLICAVALDGQGGGTDLDWPAIEAQPSGLHWVHLDFTDAGAREWVSQRSGLDKLVADALLDEDSRPRMTRYEGGLLVTLRGVNMNPDSDPEDMVSIRLWVEPDRIISTRRRTLLSVVRLRELLRDGKGPRDSGEFVAKLIQLLDARIGPVIDKLDDAIEAAEHRFAEATGSVYSGEFSALRRQAARIRRYLAPQREALERLSRDSSLILGDGPAPVFREEADQITLYLEDLDLVRERAILAQEELLGQLANEQNRRMYVLSLVAAIFLPLGFLTGLMGMNVAGLPGTESPAAFAVVSLIMFGIAIGIVALFRWRRWM